MGSNRVMSNIALANLKKCTKLRKQRLIWGERINAKIKYNLLYFSILR